MYTAEADYLTSGAPGHRSFELLEPYFSPDVVLHQAPGLPYAGTWRGHDALERFFTTMGETWSSFEMVDQRFLVGGPTSVVYTDVRARARSTAIQLEFPILQTITIGVGGICEIRPFYWDTASVAAACA